jgi:hypothetical protein
MTPYQFLLLMLGLTAGAVAVNLIHRRKRQRALVELARGWRMHYSPRDVFHLADHLAPRLPAIGAAAVSVGDVIYGNEAEFHRYIFTVEFTTGIVRSKRRETRVASFREPRGRTDPARWSPLEIAPPDRTLMDQYRALHERHATDAPADVLRRGESM